MLFVLVQLLCYLKQLLENNKTMKKIILIIAILCGNLQSINAQCEIIGKKVIKKDFPTVEFTIQNKNPEILSENQFKLFEHEATQK